ncbi:MAG: hypothetical protein JW384_02005 [Nitrosomonadaceae bacterium]|nr:hypothetical protein [Nitrosomonadaceae bacterium]
MAAKDIAMTKRWFKIWLIGNCGTKCFERFVYWYEHDDEEMADLIERELGPYSSGVRSSHWRKVSRPPKKIVLERIASLKWSRKHALSEIRIHQKELDNG